MARSELLLVRAGHHLWRQFKALKSGAVERRLALKAALEIIWAAKQEVRAELQAKRTARYLEAKQDGTFKARQAVPA